MCVSLIGFIGAAASTGMPMWRVSAFIGENIIVMEIRYEGLWMNCFQQANIRMQCKVYDSLLALSPDLQAARGLMCCSVALTGLGLLIAIAGMRCTACIQGNDRAKRMVLIIAGCMILAGCFCCIIPISWTGHAIIQDFYNPILIDCPAQGTWGGVIHRLGVICLLIRRRVHINLLQLPPGQGPGSEVHVHQERALCGLSAATCGLPPSAILGVQSPVRATVVH